MILSLIYFIHYLIFIRSIDALGECCHSSDKDICYISVSCVLALLKSLEETCGGEKMKEELIACINSQFRTLESSDYKGK